MAVPDVAFPQSTDVRPTADCSGLTSSGTESDISWSEWAGHVLDGHVLSMEQGLAILRSPDNVLLELLDAAFRIRRAYWGRTVQLYFLMNAKSGLCPEDCSYCSQSKVSTAEIPRYNLLSRDKILEGAQIAFERQAKTYCIVISARGPNEREMKAVETLVPEIKKRFSMDVCACLGLLTPEQAQRLKACGVDTVNHNLNTSEEHYSEICTTHTYQDRIQTLRAVRDAGMKLCSGGILGMGERDEDIVQMALALKDLNVESIPVNFLNPIPGTPLSGRQELTPRRCLRILSLYRFTNPKAEIRIAGGRELQLGSMQCMGLYAANSLFVGDYLTTRGQAPESDYRMIKEMGFEITRTGPG